MYRQRVVAVLTDAFGTVQGTGIVSCNIVTENSVPTQEELSYCNAAAHEASGISGSVILARIPFSRMEGERMLDMDLSKVSAVLKSSGAKKLRVPGTAVWFDCTPDAAVSAVNAVREGCSITSPTMAGKELSEKQNTATLAKKKTKASHQAADALDWDEAMRLIERLTDDGRYRDSMLIASGCFLGLRISDLLQLKWSDILSEEDITVTEKKTGKKRRMRINPSLRKQAQFCFDELDFATRDGFIFSGYLDAGNKPMTRQRAYQILSECKWTYGIKSAKVFSTHTLRKTFGRRVWLRECDNGRGDQALVLLQHVFGHSSIEITKRYLGIRQEEILSVYDNLM